MRLSDKSMRHSTPGHPPNEVSTGPAVVPDTGAVPVTKTADRISTHTSFEWTTSPAEIVLPSHRHDLLYFCQHFFIAYPPFSVDHSGTNRTAAPLLSGSGVYGSLPDMALGAEPPDLFVGACGYHLGRQRTV